MGVETKVFETTPHAGLRIDLLLGANYRELSSALRAFHELDGVPEPYDGPREQYACLGSPTLTLRGDFKRVAQLALFFVGYVLQLGAVRDQPKLKDWVWEALARARGSIDRQRSFVSAGAPAAPFLTISLSAERIARVGELLDEMAVPAGALGELLLDLACDVVTPKALMRANTIKAATSSFAYTGFASAPAPPGAIVEVEFPENNASLKVRGCGVNEARRKALIDRIGGPAKARLELPGSHDPRSILHSVHPGIAHELRQRFRESCAGRSGTTGGAVLLFPMPP